MDSAVAILESSVQNVYCTQPARAVDPRRIPERTGPCSVVHAIPVLHALAESALREFYEMLPTGEGI